MYTEIEMFLEIPCYILPRDPQKISPPELIDVNRMAVVAIRKSMNQPTIKLMMQGGLILECDIKFLPILKQPIKTKIEYGISEKG